MYDTIILGAGPAGLSAAINLKLRNKSFLWFGSPAMSAKVEKSEKIANYPGLGLVSGAELNARFRAHAAALELAPTDKMVTLIADMGGSFSVLAENDIYEAKTVLLTIGAAVAKGYEGEKELLGSGVSYCATCDGFLYKGKTIAVYCAAPRYEEEVAYLAGIAEKVYLYTPYSGCGISLPNVERLPAPIKAVGGNMRVQFITLTDGTELPVSGLFCLRDSVAPASLLPGLLQDGPHITVDRRMATNILGVFAAGDCTGRPYQIAKAVGEGNTAAHSILEYLAETENK